MFKFIHKYLLFIIYYRQVLKLLKNKNIEQIKIFNFKNWHHGYAYLSGFKDNKKVFIKIDTKLLLLQNDLLVYNIANESLKKYLVKIYNSIILDDIQIIIYEFLSGTELSNNIILENPKLIDNMVDILLILNKLDIVHRDIKFDNFFIVNNQIKIIDFTFANSSDDSLGFKELNLSNASHCETLEFLGNGLNPKPFTWNDFCSLANALELLNKEKEANIDIRKIKLLDSKSYSVQCNKLYLKLRNRKIKLKNFFNIAHKHRDITNIKNEFIDDSK